MKLLLLIIILFICINSIHSASNKRIIVNPLKNEEEENSAPIDCSKVPPALWCQNQKLAESCGFKDICKKYDDSTKNQKLQLTLFYESLCPDCQEFILGTFYRDAYLTFGDYIDIELVPYGNARIEDDEIKCQHGEKECEINKYESCVLHFMKEPIPFIVCLESRIKDGSSLEKAAEKCYYTFKVGPHIADQIIHCANSDLGKQFQLQAAKRTAQAWPDQHKFVPWMLFNNVSIENYQFLLGGMQTAICQFYNGDKMPGHCKGLGSTYSIFVDENRKTLMGCPKNALGVFEPEGF